MRQRESKPIRMFEKKTIQTYIKNLYKLVNL